MENDKKVRDLNQRLNELFDRYVEKQVKNENLTGELTKRQKMLDEKTEIISILRKQTFDDQATLVEIETNLEKFKEANKQLEKRCSTLEKELDEADKIRTKLEDDNYKLTAKVESRTKQTEQLAVDLLNARIQLEENEKKYEQLKLANDELKEQLCCLNANKRLQHFDSPLVKLRSNPDGSPLFSVSSQKPGMDSDNNNNFESLSIMNDIKVSEYQERTLKLQEEVNTLQQSLDSKEEELTEAYKLVDELKLKVEEKEKKIQQVTHELNTAQKPMTDHEYDLLVNEVFDLRGQIKSANHRLTELSRNEELNKLKKELDLVETSWKAERVHKERYARENMQLERHLSDVKKSLHQLSQKYDEVIQQNQQLSAELAQTRAVTPEAPVMSDQKLTYNVVEETPNSRSFIKKNIRVPVGTASNLTIADEVGEMMNSTALPSRTPAYVRRNVIDQMTGENHDQKLPLSTKVDHQALRYDRMTELARRNMKQAPLQRSTYALELDTFDKMALSEDEFKRGHILRPALVDQSNNHNKPNRVAKPCSFIVT